jgi:hypothetical protein
MITKNKNTVIPLRPERIYRGLTKSIILVLFPIIFLNITLISIADNVQVKVIPFKTGEKLTYKGNFLLPLLLVSLFV